MSKKSLLLCTATATILLFGTHYNLHAENIDINKKGEVKTATQGATYGYLQAVNGSKIIGKNLTIVGGHPINDNLMAVVAKTGSSIELWNTTIKSDNDTEMDNGLEIWQGSIIKMNGGSIAAKNIAIIDTDDSGESILENVKTSGSKENKPARWGIEIRHGTVNLKNVTVSKAEIYAVEASSKTKVIISKGSFGGIIHANQGSTITLNDNVTVTSEKNGLHADGDKAQITMTGGTVKGQKSALLTENGGYIDVTDITLTADGKGTGAKSIGPNSMIDLHDNATIKEAVIGLEAKDNGVIQMTGGSITVSQTGASFENNNNDKNKLENVVIKSSSDDKPITTGVSADKKSTLALKNITVTNAKKALFANDNSQITVTGGGSFGGEVQAKQGSTITLNDNVKVTSEDDGLHAEGDQSKITMTGGTVTGSNSVLYTKAGGYIHVKDVAMTANGSGTKFGAFARGPSTIELNGNTTIKNASVGVKAQSSNATIKMTGGSIEISGGDAIGAFFYDTSSKENKLQDVKISTDKDTFLMENGVSVGKKSSVTLDNVTITQTQSAIFANEESQITISGGSFEAEKDTVYAKQGSTITLDNNAKATSSNGNGLHAEGNQSKITMTGGTVRVKEAAFIVENGGHIDGTNITAIAENKGIKFDDALHDQTSEINLTNTNLLVEDGTGIVANNSLNGKLNLKDSKINADRLFVSITHDTPKPDQIFILTAENSLLQGGVRNDENSRTTFDLKNNTIWTLKNSAKEKDEDGNLLDIAQRSRSDISTLNLDNSSIIFNGPTEDHYHTLHIGSGKPDTKAVYNATGDAQIHFNTEWSDGIASADQKTDRLLIHGDVEGKTAVYVTGRLEENNVKANTSVSANTRGVSLIQVSGKAQEDSFKLVNGYTTRNGSPDMYTLRAYGPDSSQGKANIAQNLFDEKNEDFWDFRLQPEILETGSGSTGPGSNPTVVAPVPQTAGYIVMPNALFYSGLVDMAKQNALLANMRASVLGKEEEKNTGFFLYTYGSTGTLSSERGPLKYGYGADLRYAALQGGVTLSALEGQNSTTHFGLVATYGQLSFTPKDMKDAGKNTLDKWSLTAYGSSQYDNGFYIDTLLSYGILKGDITNAIIGKTAKLKNAKMLSLSTTVGKEFATGTEGLTLEPQAQLAYQHLMFDTITDVNNFTVDMNNPHQWMIRVGGRLTKTLSTENNRLMSFYGKVNLIKTFGDDGTIQIGRSFDLDPMGAAIEGGVGINAQLSHNFSLHGDVSYQQKLQKTGISGASFSGGIRYQF
ncbi:outer membrane autotransporter barrel domain-containing protein [Bartonella vinsonii subsp. arupensis OK-94-513]|uniref:Outer membrane autotransporter barrel domain-containing protein n=1 Tax=Bartonella vinsonii subsp. arupensis OK-94-513 TaxID=1094562 RepID=J0QYY8_BARVI|nr:autotransporter outer membrane beta-barrel domain-containing protein [Bartonella vinsonii]EJF88394.1 outer membrane autotransporter barrel domain-containing protein [Bartonella vinsonii subsp. arupensis OK-94-513]